MRTRHTIFTLARLHLANQKDGSSARECMAMAMKFSDAGDMVCAERWALRSLFHSVGILHPDYARGWRMVKGETPVTTAI